MKTPVDTDLKGDDAMLLQFGRGTALLFFDVFWPPGGDQVYVARGRLAP